MTEFDSLEIFKELLYQSLQGQTDKKVELVEACIWAAMCIGYKPFDICKSNIFFDGGFDE